MKKVYDANNLSVDTHHKVLFDFFITLSTLPLTNRSSYLVTFSILTQINYMTVTEGHFVIINLNAARRFPYVVVVRVGKFKI